MGQKLSDLARANRHHAGMATAMVIGGKTQSRSTISANQVAPISVSYTHLRMGINETLLAKYICGYSKPSEKRAKEIEAALHDLGHKLSLIHI